MNFIGVLDLIINSAVINVVPIFTRTMVLRRVDDGNISFSFCYDYMSSVRYSVKDLTDDDHVVDKLVGWNLEIERCRAFPDSSTGIVVRTVAGTVIATVIAGISDWNTTEMSANAENNQPFWTFDALRIGLRVAKL